MRYAKNSVFQGHLLEIFLLNEKQNKPFVSLNDEVTEAWHLLPVVQTDTSFIIHIIM